MQNVLQKPPKPRKTTLPHKMQIEVRGEAVSYVWIDWMDRGSLHGGAGANFTLYCAGLHCVRRAGDSPLIAAQVHSQHLPSVCRRVTRVSIPMASKLNASVRPATGL